MNLTLFFIIVTCIISIPAFRNHQTIENLIFYPYRMWRNNEWHRLISCGFIHADGMHLLFNMYALYSFGRGVEYVFGELFAEMGLTLYVLMYFGAIATADIFNLFTKKDDYSYRSLGASGGVSAIVFSYILFAPRGKLGLIFIPFMEIPAFIFGGFYLAYCIYMAKRGTDNIGHTAHFTGAIFGFFFPVLFKPELLSAFFQQILNGN